MGDVECCKNYENKQNGGKISSCDKTLFWGSFKKGKHAIKL